MSRKLKLAFIIPSLNMGGAENQLVTTINKLVRLQDQVFLVVLSDQLDLLPLVNLPKAQLLLLQEPSQSTLNGKGVSQSLQSARKLTAFLKQNRIECVVAKLPMAHFVARLSFVVGKLSGYPFHLVSYYHSMQTTASPVNRFDKKMFMWINRQLSRLSDGGSICISQAVLKDVTNLVHLQAPIVIYNFAEGNLTPTRHQVMIEKEEKYWIIVPGRIERVKGQLFFIESLMNHLSLEVIYEFNIRILLVGGGSVWPAIESKIVETEWADLVKATGPVSHDDMIEYMQLADLIVIPSLSEGLGNTAIEALMLGKKVLSSDSGGLTEVIIDNKTGYTFSAGNGKELVHKLSNILDGKWTITSEDQRNFYEQHFSPVRYITQLRNYLFSIR